MKRLMVFLLFATPLAHGVPITHGALTSNDDGSTEIIADSLNNYEWLRWDVLDTLTYAETLVAISTGGAYEGWQIAHNAEAQLFVDALFFGSAHLCNVSNTRQCRIVVSVRGSTRLTTGCGPLAARATHRVQLV